MFELLMLSSAVVGAEKEVYMRKFGANLVACWLLLVVGMRRVGIEWGSESFDSSIKNTLSFTRLWWTTNPIELASHDAISRFLNEWKRWWKEVKRREENGMEVKGGNVPHDDRGIFLLASLQLPSAVYLYSPILYLCESNAGAFSWGTIV